MEVEWAGEDGDGEDPLLTEGLPSRARVLFCYCYAPIPESRHSRRSKDKHLRSRSTINNWLGERNIFPVRISCIIFGSSKSRRFGVNLYGFG